MAERKRKTRGRSSSNSANYLIDLCPISRLYYRLLGKLLSSRQIKMLITRILSFHSNHAFFVHNFVGPRSRKGWILMQRQDSFKLASLFIFLFFFLFSIFVKINATREETNPNVCVFKDLSDFVSFRLFFAKSFS